MSSDSDALDWLLDRWTCLSQWTSCSCEGYCYWQDPFWMRPKNDPLLKPHHCQFW